MLDNSKSTASSCEDGSVTGSITCSVSCSLETSSSLPTNVTQVNNKECCDAVVRTAGSKFRRSVNFDLKSNIAYRNHQSYEEDIHQLWYGSQDYQMFKRKSVEDAKEIIRTERAAVGRRFGAYTNAMKLVFESCCSGNTLFESELAIFQKAVCTSRVGLERLSIRSIHLDKKVRRANLAEAVLEIQESCYDCEDVDQIISAAAQEISLPSRLFAIHLAQAQALAI